MSETALNEQPDTSTASLHSAPPQLASTPFRAPTPSLASATLPTPDEGTPSVSDAPLTAPAPTLPTPTLGAPAPTTAPPAPTGPSLGAPALDAPPIALPADAPVLSTSPLDGQAPQLAISPLAAPAPPLPTPAAAPPIELPTDAPVLPMQSPVLQSAEAPMQPGGDTPAPGDPGENDDDDSVPEHPMAHLMPKRSTPTEASRRAAEQRAEKKAKAKKIKIGVVAGALVFTAVVGPPLFRWLADAINEAGGVTVEETEG